VLRPLAGAALVAAAIVATVAGDDASRTVSDDLAVGPAATIPPSTPSSTVPPVAGVTSTPTATAATGAAATTPGVPPGTEATPSLEVSPAASLPAPAAAPPTTETAGTAPPRPRATGHPNASNTGVPPGTALAPSGPITTTQDGQVIDALDVDGQIHVVHDDVVVRRTRVRNPGAEAIWLDPQRHGLLVEDCELDGHGNTTAAAAVAYARYTIRRCDIHHFGEGLAAFGDVTAEGNWLHDFTDFIGEGAHQDGIQVEFGDDVVLRHNTVMQNVEGANAAIWVSGQPHSNVVIEDNLVAGANFAVGAGSQPGVRVVNNRVSRAYYPDGGAWGPFTYTSGVQMSGNVWHETGQSVG
jgi:hypothetical protein